MPRHFRVTLPEPGSVYEVIILDVPDPAAGVLPSVVHQFDVLASRLVPVVVMEMLVPAA